jgi:hypothetical protein
LLTITPCVAFNVSLIMKNELMLLKISDVVINAINAAFPLSRNNVSNKVGIPSHTYVINKDARIIAGIRKRRSNLRDLLQSISVYAIEALVRHFIQYVQCIWLTWFCNK